MESKPEYTSKFNRRLDRVTPCGYNLFVELYRNVTNATDPAVRKAAMAELGEYLRGADYKSALSCRKYLKKSTFRRQMVYTALRYLGIKATAAVSRLADLLENIMGRMTLLVRIERRLKGMIH